MTRLDTLLKEISACRLCEPHLPVPTGFCYPGSGPRGDAPPRPECAPLWHPPLRALMPHIRLTRLIGQYARLLPANAP